MAKAKKRGFWGGLLVLGLGAGVLVLASLANGPDKDVTFTREIESPVDSATLGRAIANLSNWPRWHYMATEAKALDFRGDPLPIVSQVAGPGEVVRLKIVPPTRQWKRFELYAEITGYEKNKRIDLRIVRDSTGRIVPTMFSSVQWSIELLPPPAGSNAKTLIRGTLHAHTANWRSRLFTAIAERILLNQIFYPNFYELAKLQDPWPVNPTPQTQQ